MAEFIKDNTLVKAMREMKANNDNALKNVFVREMMKAKFLVPANIDPAPENGQIKKGSVVSYHALRNSADDKKLMLVFTSRGEFDKMPTANYILTHDYNQVCRIVKAKDFDGFIIDPKGENVAVSKELMERINEARPLAVSTEKVTVKGEQAPLVPAGESASEELKQTLKAYLESQEDIDRLWLMETMRDGDKKPTLVLVADFSDASNNKVFNGLARALKSEIKLGDALGMMSLSDTVAAEAAADVEPFFTKE